MIGNSTAEMTQLEDFLNDDVPQSIIISDTDFNI